MRKILFLTLGCLSSLFLAAQNTNYFFKTLNAERGATTCLDASGNLWVGSRRQGEIQLTKMSPDGTVLDRAYLDIAGGTGTSDNLAEILVDSDGMIVGCGNFDEIFGSGFAFRYDPTADKLLWAKTFESIFSNTASGIMERGPGGHFTALNSSLFGEAELLTFDRLTGNVRPADTHAYSYGAYKTFNAAVLHKGFFYTTGLDETGDSHLLLSTSKISAASGVVEWTRLSPRVPLTFNGDFIGQDILVDNDSLVSVSLGGPPNTGLLTHTIMQKNAPNGDLIWAKRYILFSPDERSSIVVEDVANVADGYVMFGRTYNPTSNTESNSTFFLIKTDKKGKPQWARLMGKNWEVNTPYFPYQNQILATQDALYIIGDGKNETGQQQTFLFKTNLSGNVEGCDYIQAAGVQAIDLTTPSNEASLLLPASTTVLVQNVSVGVKAGTAPSIATQCEAKAACINLPDATLRFDGMTCSGGARTAHFALCNVGSDTLFGPVSLGFYPKNPLSEATQRVASYTVALDHLAPGACVLRNEPLAALGLENFPQLHCLVGAADVPTPISPASFPLSGAATECDYTNNLSNWRLDVKGAAPNLGPNVAICPGKSATLSTGTNAIGYLWQDGSTAATLTATAAGLYWLEITDECGVKQRDSVRVTVLPTPTRAQTVPFVQGGSVTIGGTVYTQPGTVTLQVPSTNGGCDSLITYTLAWVPAEVKITCPANLTTAIPLGQNTATLAYALPTTSTNCPNPALTINRLQGPAPGSALGEGTVTVCYQATDNCNAQSSCCFTVTVNAAPDPCESKTVGCIRYDLYSFLQDATSRTYRLRVVNNCASAVQTLNFQLPSGAVALSPADGSVYAAPSGKKYDVRNASTTPFYSLRLRAKTSGIATGQSDYFEYKLPNQAPQAYILAYSRLANGETYLAHLSTSQCTVEAAADTGDAAERSDDAALLTPHSSPLTLESLQISPNPTSGEVSLRLPESWQPSQSVHISVLNAQGQLVQESDMTTSDGGPLLLTLDAGLSRGLYYLLAQTPEGQRAAVRCVLR